MSVHNSAVPYQEFLQEKMAVPVRADMNRQSFYNVNECSGESEARVNAYSLLHALTRQFWGAVSPLFLHEAIRILREELPQQRTLSDWFDFTYNYEKLLRGPAGVQPWFSIAPTQNKGEFLSLLKIVQGLEPRRILEIGTGTGGTLFMFARMANPDSSLVSIDLPSSYGAWKVPLYLSFAESGQTIHAVRADSHESRTVGKVRSYLKGNHLDFLFIDGDHSYAGVSRDFDLYSPFVRQRGVVALHDIALSVFDVPRFWTELKNEYQTVEFIDEGKQYRFGIGILRKA